MKPKIGVGLESTVDVLITFSEMGDFENFTQIYEGELSNQVRTGYETVAKGSGGEVPIDGKREEAEKLVNLAEEKGAKIFHQLGGNAAQEAATLERIGSESIFLGALFPKSLSKVSSKDSASLEGTETRFARTYDEYAPASYILQVQDGNRYILSEGEGRRIDQLRPYLKDLPNIINQVNEFYGSLDALSLVGWQVIFGNELSEEDFKLTCEVIREVREDNEFFSFTDAGGIGALDEKEREMLWKIYSLFDILSLNEDELFLISEDLGFDKDDIIRAMHDFLEKSENLSTVWLHTPNYQATVTKDFERARLEMAQGFSSIAGLYKVEQGSYPSPDQLSRLLDERSYVEEGLEKKDEIEDRYGKEIEGYEIVITPCYQEESFVSTVGAGDVSSAAFLHSLLKDED